MFSLIKKKVKKLKIIFNLNFFRYLIALKRSRQTDSTAEDGNKSNIAPPVTRCDGRTLRSGASTDRATLGLGKVGSRAALNFAFAFLRRAWRSGEDADLCTELLQVNHVTQIK